MAQLVLKELIARYPELNQDFFKELELENVPEEQKTTLMEAYYENVGSRFMDTVLTAHLTDEQKSTLSEILDQENVDQAPVIDFLNENVPDWTEILQVQMAQAKLDLMNTTKRIQEMAKQIVEQQAPAQPAEAPMPVEPQPVAVAPEEPKPAAPEQSAQEPTPLQ
ncbi:MAG: hypothetical protein HZA35_02840 [Parcubacteria group bacterium]|nr:hypothetical protein [Parcubacteria group bacterium]